MEMAKQENKNTEIAGRTYHTSDYQRSDELSNGLAVTHEQASDSYAVGEIGLKEDNKSDEEKAELTKRGYQ
jgi:hypothetical protein